MDFAVTINISCYKQAAFAQAAGIFILESSIATSGVVETWAVASAASDWETSLAFKSA